MGLVGAVLAHEISLWTETGKREKLNAEVSALKGTYPSRFISLLILQFTT